MSQKVTFVNSILREVKRTKRGGTAKFAAPMTGKISASFGWDDIPETFKGGTPDNSELQASKVELVPNNSELKGFATEFEASHIGSFQIVKLKVKKGPNSVRSKQRETELQFVVGFSDEAGCGKLERYMQSAARSKMTVYYQPEPVQEELPGAQGDEKTAAAAVQ